MYYQKDKEAQSREDRAARDAFEKKYPPFAKVGNVVDLYSEEIYCVSEAVINEERYNM